MADLIDRQAILKHIEKIRQGVMMDGTRISSVILNGMDLCEKAVMNQPPIQLEIIHCKDCKNSKHWYGDRRRCFLWSEDGVSVFDDGYCNYAVREGEDNESIR